MNRDQLQQSIRRVVSGLKPRADGKYSTIKPMSDGETVEADTKDELERILLAAFDAGLVAMHERASDESNEIINDAQRRREFMERAARAYALVGGLPLPVLEQIIAAEEANPPELLVDLIASSEEGITLEDVPEEVKEVAIRYTKMERLKTLMTLKRLVNDKKAGAMAPDAADDEADLLEVERLGDLRQKP